MTNYESACKIINEGAADILIIKPTLTGSFNEIKKILTLSNNQLVALPPEIEELKQLTNLDLEKNQLATLPAEIGELKQLIHLYLSNNQLKAMPLEIGELKQLRWLSLYNAASCRPIRWEVPPPHTTAYLSN